MDNVALMKQVIASTDKVVKGTDAFPTRSPVSLHGVDSSRRDQPHHRRINDVRSLRRGGISP